jgi:hypothetical protein
MKQRCYNPKSNSYHNYGARGIRICDRWLESFNNFLEDMGYRPSPQHSIDRVDNDGNYEPSNCRWATKQLQGMNRRPTRLSSVGIRGVQPNGRNWLAEMTINNKRICLGTFKTIEEASAVYEKRRAERLKELEETSYK